MFGEMAYFKTTPKHHLIKRKLPNEFKMQVETINFEKMHK